jgi:exopolyphosphatase/guanosine-5'-triphosphate,3'-diphosphate pyrophosphatase
LTRYHRRGGPSRRHEGYSGLPGPLRRTVKVLSSFLRLAEALDRSKHRTVKTLDVRSRGKALSIRLSVINDPELEMWAAVRHLELMSKELGRDVRLEARRLQEPEIAPRARKRKAA